MKQRPAVGNLHGVCTLFAQRLPVLKPVCNIIERCFLFFAFKTNHYFCITLHAAYVKYRPSSQLAATARPFGKAALRVSMKVSFVLHLGVCEWSGALN